MSYELKMPKLGESVTEGTIGKWLKQPGEKVNKYDLLVEVQTDKVNTEIPSPVAGTLKEVKVQEGQTVPIGTLLAVSDAADGEAAAAQTAPTSAAAQPPKPSQPAGVPPASGRLPSGRSAPGGPYPQGPSAVEPPPSRVPPAPTPEAPPPSRAPFQQPPQRPSPTSTATATEERPDLSDVRATPAVRKLATEHGIDISEIDGTGLGGRLSRRGVDGFIAQRPSQEQAGRTV